MTVHVEGIRTAFLSSLIIICGAGVHDPDCVGQADIIGIVLLCLLIQLFWISIIGACCIPG